MVGHEAVVGTGHLQGQRAVLVYVLTQSQIKYNKQCYEQASQNYKKIPIFSGLYQIMINPAFTKQILKIHQKKHISKNHGETQPSR